MKSPVLLSDSFTGQEPNIAALRRRRDEQQLNPAWSRGRMTSRLGLSNLPPSGCRVTRGHKERPQPARKMAGGFTLIELLVVLGIIGILAGLLLPVLSRARERSRSVNCVNNLKQVGVGMTLYVDEYDSYYPPGREAGVTQWDLCVGAYVGGSSDPTALEARTRIFMCPSVKVINRDIRLNYSANPNVCKEVSGNIGAVRSLLVTRTADTIVAADAIQYAADGSTHAIFWGVNGSGNSPIYWNDGKPETADVAIPVGADKDATLDVSDPAGSNFRYRHNNGAANALVADGHVGSFTKGRIRDRHVYINY